MSDTFGQLVFPERSPTWSEIGLAVLLVGSVMSQLASVVESVTALTTAVLVGIAAVGLCIHETRRSPRSRERPSARTLLFRTAILILVLATLLVALQAVPVPEAVLSGVVVGLILGIVGYLTAWVLLVRRVRGWTPVLTLRPTE